VRSTCHHEACTFPRKQGVDWVIGGERALYWVISAPDRTDGNSGLTTRTTMSAGGVECRFHRLGWSNGDSLRLFAGEGIVRATAGVGSRLPLDQTMPDLDAGVKPDGRIPASAVCPWGAHPVSVSSGRTMGIIDGIVECPRRLYVIHPLLA
jgi:hypothetical protein